MEAVDGSWDLGRCIGGADGLGVAGCVGAN